MRLDVHPAADRELAEIARYINEQRSGYGDRLLAAFARACELLLNYPRAGPRTRGGRRKRISGFRYDVIYRIHDDVIFIVAVAHHRRRAFWLRRR